MEGTNLGQQECGNSEAMQGRRQSNTSWYIIKHRKKARLVALSQGMFPRKSYAMKACQNSSLGRGRTVNLSIPFLFLPLTDQHKIFVRGDISFALGKNVYLQLLNVVLYKCQVC